MKTIFVALGLAAAFAVSGCVVCDDAPDRRHRNTPPHPQKAHVHGHGGQAHAPPPPQNHGGHHR